MQRVDSSHSSGYKVDRLRRRMLPLMTPMFPDVTVKLTDEDGNIFFIIGRITRAMKKAGVEKDEITTFTNEVMTAGSYDGALRVCMRWVNCV